MSKKRLLGAIFLPLILVSFLQAQSLAELAKKEKARRAALKGRPATVVTTADLARVKLRPAVESSAQEQAVEEGEEAAQAGAAEGRAQGVTPPVAGGQAAAGQAAESAAQADKPVEELPPGAATAPSAQDLQKKQNELAEIAQQKAEMVDLLTIKMNALYQEFYGLDNLKSRELVQLQISDTYDKLLMAETESAKARKDLEDFLAQTKKDSTPQLWIR